MIQNVACGFVVLMLLKLALGVMGDLDGGADPAPGAAPPPAGQRIDPARPFAGSPAEYYADGVKGFQPPKARAMGGFTAREVAAAYRNTRRLMAAAVLDRRTVLGGRPATFAALLDPEQRRAFLKGLDAEKRKDDTRGWVLSIAPGRAELVGSVIKVHGKMKAEPATRWGWRGLEITTDYLVVYAIREPGAPGTTMRLVTRFGDTTFHRRGHRPWLVMTAGLAAAPIECGSFQKDDFIYPAFGEPEARDDRSGEPVDPYAEAAGIEEGACQTVVRT